MCSFSRRSIVVFPIFADKYHSLTGTLLRNEPFLGFAELAHALPCYIPVAHVTYLYSFFLKEKHQLLCSSVVALDHTVGCFFSRLSLLSSPASSREGSDFDIVAEQGALDPRSPPMAALLRTSSHPPVNACDVVALFQFLFSSQQRSHEHEEEEKKTLYTQHEEMPPTLWRWSEKPL
eukprot:scaffold78995_cov48-Attheya_sp.AAC.7